jgi:hypothetical protein
VDERKPAEVTLAGVRIPLLDYCCRSNVVFVLQDLHDVALAMQNPDDANRVVIGDVRDAYSLKTGNRPGTQILKTGIPRVTSRADVRMFSQIFDGATYGI